MRRWLGTSERAADVDGDSKIDENGDLFAFTPTQSALRNDSIKPTKVRPPVTSENSAEIMGVGGGSPCKALLSRYVELWLRTVRFNNAAFSCFSYTDSCIQSQACKRNSRYCSVITVALLINEVYGFSKELHKFVILAFFFKTYMYFPHACTFSK